MIIMIGIVSRFPGAIIGEAAAKGMRGSLIFLIEMVVLFLVVMAVIVLTQAVRRIPVQYAKQVGGTTQLNAQRQFIPLKVNAAGVMPIIFAQSLMFVPAIVASIWQNDSDTASYIGVKFSDYTSWQYNLVFATLIIIFTYFYTAISVNPNQIADDLKRSGGFVPGVKPGRDTSEHMDEILTRITLAWRNCLGSYCNLSCSSFVGWRNSSFLGFLRWYFTDHHGRRGIGYAQSSGKLLAHASL